MHESKIPQKSAKKSQDLVRIRRPKATKKKQLFEALSFVEGHQETFYLGLNENVIGVLNPVQAKVIDIENAEDLAKDWVF